jgi:hypothetical protein
MYKNVSDKFKGEKGVLSRGRTNIGYIQPINENTISGTSVSIIDGIKDKTELTIDGKSTQETRSGKNLLNVTAESFTTSGVTVTINPDKTIVLNGKYTGTAIFWRRLAPDFTIPAGTYTISNGNPDASTSTAIFKDDSNNFDIVDVSTKTFTEEKVIKPYLRIAVGSSFNNFKIYPMIVYGDTVGEYEPYGVSPSPDYPSEIENTKGKNLINPNLPVGSETKDGITLTNNGDGTYTVKGTATKTTGIDLTTQNVIKLKGNTYYTNSIEVLSGKMDGFITVSVKGKDDVTKFNYINLTPSNYIHTVKTKEDLTVVRYNYYIAEGTTVDFTFRVQLEKGSIATRYVPYGNIQIVETGKNSFNPAINFRASIGGLTNTLNPDGSITISGKPTYDFVQIVGVKDITDELEDGKVYTLSQTNSQNKFFAAISAKKSDGTTTYFGSGSGSVSITINKSIYTNYLIYVETSSIANWGDESLTITSAFQLEEGPVATDYEPYTEEVVNIDLKGNELTKYDKLIIKDGKATIQKKSRHLSSAIKNMNNFEDYPGWQPQPELLKDYPNKNGSFDGVPISYMTNISNSGFRVNLNTVGSNGVIFLSKSVYGLTQTQWKEKYPDLVFDLIYELAEPYEIDLGEVATLKTFNGTTYITNSEDAEMSVKYSQLGDKISKFVQGQFMLQDKCSVDGKLIGNVIAKNFECQIYSGKTYNLVDKRVRVHTGLRFDDGTEEYVPWGDFIVDTYENVESSNYVSIKAMDYMVKFNPAYIDNSHYPCYLKDWVVNFANYFDVELGDLSYKLTADTEINTEKIYYTKNGDDYEPVDNPEKENISTYYEVDLGSVSNQNFEIIETPEIANKTGREILKNVAEMFGSFATIGRDNKLYFKLKEKTRVKIPKSPTLHSLTKNEKYGEINVVVLKLGQAEGENVTKRDEASIAEHGENIIQIEDNVFLNSQAKREMAINELFDRLKGFSYVDFSAEWNNFMYLDSGDAIECQNKDDDTYFETMLLNQTLYIPNTTKSTISAPSESKAEEKYQFTEEQKQINLYTELRVNKVEGAITATTKKTQDISDDLNNNYYTKTNVNTLLQTAESGITNTFSEAGGNNIFRNTGLWFKADTANIRNLYNGSFIYCTYNSDAVNKSLTNVYPSSTSVTSYIRSEELMEINSAYEYSLDVPELTYKHGDATLSYKTSLLELTSNREFQLENGKILKHELSAGSSTIKFKKNTIYVMLLLENQNFSRNIIVGDDLNGKTIYSSLPDNFYETLNEQAVTTSMFVKTSTSNAIGVHTKLSKGLFNVGCNTISNFEQSIMPTINFYIKNDITTVNEKSLKMSDTFGTVTEIDKNNLAYPYLKIGIATNLEIADAKTTLKELSIQIKTSDNLYEFWEGEIVRNSNDEAANNNSMLLLNGEVYQEQEVPNGNYAISFMYQKLNELANASVLINDKEYQLDSTELKQFYTGEQDNETKEYITQPVEVTTNHIRITFKCDVDNAVEIYDLMCNKGTVKLAYSQNENETTTETVNISKGITITSTNMETIFKANANGIRILTLQHATIAYFTDKGLSTKEIIVEDEAQICRTLIQNVGDQTWFTRM